MAQYGLILTENWGVGKTNTKGRTKALLIKERKGENKKLISRLSLSLQCNYLFVNSSSSCRDKEKKQSLINFQK